MANYKLTNDYWEASGIYDIGQGKTQREINKVAGKAGESQTVTDDIVTITDGVEGVPVKNLTVNIDPVQSGTGDPSPTNVRPISGWTGAKLSHTGKNFFNPDITGVNQSRCTCTIANNTYSVTPSATDWSVGTLATTGNYSSAYGTKQYCQKGQTLKIVTSNSIINKNYVSFYGSDNEVVSYARVDLDSFTVPDDAEYFTIRFGTQSSTSAVTFTLMIVDASETDTTFEPYVSEAYDITFPSSAGTVYGGTLDVTNGVLTVNRVGQKFENVTTSNVIGWGSTGTTLNSCRLYLSPLAPFVQGDAGLRVMKCNVLPTAKNTDVYYGNAVGVSTHNNGYCGIRIDGATTVQDYVDFINNNDFFLSWEIATPVTYTLTPIEIRTLLGQNNFWADCGDVNVQYGAYLTVVENQLGEKIPKLMLAPVEKTTTASKAYVLNELLIMGDTLYKVTSPIANGGTITVGTNVTETTIGAVLTSLLNA